MRIVEILGPQCPQSEELLHRVQQAVSQTGVRTLIKPVTDMDLITSYRVMQTPALVVDEQVRAVGRVPTIEEIAAWLVGG